MISSGLGIRYGICIQVFQRRAFSILYQTIGFAWLQGQPHAQLRVSHSKQYRTPDAPGPKCDPSVTLIHLGFGFNSISGISSNFVLLMGLTCSTPGWSAGLWCFLNMGAKNHFSCITALANSIPEGWTKGVLHYRLYILGLCLLYIGGSPLPVLPVVHSTLKANLTKRSRYRSPRWSNDMMWFDPLRLTALSDLLDIGNARFLVWLSSPTLCRQS